MKDHEPTEFCKNCNRKTPYRAEHESLKGPGAFAKLKTYCKECGELTGETTFK
jgi:RNase P subunit RPR2